MVAIIFFFVCLFNFLLFTGVNFYAQVKICIDDKRTVDRRVHFFLLRHEIYSCLTLESLKFAIVAEVNGIFLWLIVSARAEQAPAPPLHSRAASPAVCTLRAAR